VFKRSGRPRVHEPSPTLGTRCTSLVILGKGIVTVGFAVGQMLEATPHGGTLAYIHAPFAPRWIALALGGCGIADIAFHKELKWGAPDVWRGSILSACVVVGLVLIGRTTEAMFYPAPLLLSSVVALIFLLVFRAEFEPNRLPTGRRR
jgi:hypothetical protein